MCASWFLENNPKGSQQQFNDAFDVIARSQARSSVPDRILDILREELSLMVQVGTSAACRNPAFPRWFSQDPADALFGAHMDFVQHPSWAGMFVWVDSCKSITTRIFHRFLTMACVAPVRLLIFDPDESLVTSGTPGCLYRAVYRTSGGTVRMFQNTAAAATAPVHWRRLNGRLASMDTTTGTDTRTEHDLHSPVHPLLYWMDVEAPVAQSAFLPPPNTTPATVKALEKQHCFGRLPALLGGQPDGLQAALRVLQPGVDVVDPDEITNTLRMIALECSFRLYTAYTRGLHAWVRTAATSNHLMGMLDMAVPVAAPPPVRTSAWSDRLRNRGELEERNRLARSSSAFPMVCTDEEDEVYLPGAELRRAIIRRWTLARD